MTLLVQNPFSAIKKNKKKCLFPKEPMSNLLGSLADPEPQKLIFTCMGYHNSHSQSVFWHRHRPGPQTVFWHRHRPGPHTVFWYRHRPGPQSVFLHRHRPGPHTVFLHRHRQGHQTVFWRIHHPGPKTIFLHRHRQGPRASSDIVIAQVPRASSHLHNWFFCDIDRLKYNRVLI